MAVNDVKSWIGSTGPYLSDSSKAVSGLQTDKFPLVDNDATTKYSARELHKDYGVGYIHIPYNWEYANAIARLAATGFTAAQVGKLARQLDNNSIWILINHSPITWIVLGGLPVPVNDEDLLMSLSGMWKEVDPIVSLTTASWLMNDSGQFIVRGVI